MKARYFFLLLPTFVKLWLAAVTELSVDEAHYVNYGRWVDWSYFDHPPLVGWVQALQRFLPFHEFWVRLPAICVGAILFFDIYFWLRRKTGNENWSFWITQFLQISPILAGMSFLWLPETSFLLFAWWLFRVMDESTVFSWRLCLKMGILFGLAGLAKYTAVLLIPGFLWESWRRRWYLQNKFSVKVVVSILTAILVVSPVLYWNWINDFASFKYQTGHVIQKEFSLQQLLVALAGIFIGYGMLQTPLLVRLYWAKGHPSFTWAKRFMVFPALFFLSASLTNAILPHWPAILVLVGFCVSWWSLLLSFDKRALSWLKFSTLLSSLLALFVISQLFVPLPAFGLASRDILGWRHLKQIFTLVKSIPDSTTPSDLRLELKPAERENLAGLITLHWTIASRALVYFSDVISIHVVDDRVDQYDRWLKSPEHMGSYLVLQPSFMTEDPTQKLSCGDLRLIKAVPVQLNNLELFKFNIWYCSKFKKSL